MRDKDPKTFESYWIPLNRNNHIYHQLVSLTCHKTSSGDYSTHISLLHGLDTSALVLRMDLWDQRNLILPGMFFSDYFDWLMLIMIRSIWCKLMIILILYRQVGVDHRTIATMYSVRAAGTVASSLLVGYLFGSSFFTQKPGEGGCRKLALLSISQAIIAVSLMAVPFVKSFSVLLIGKRL